MGDADTEAIESARHKQALAEGMEDHFEDTYGNLFNSEKRREPTVLLFDEDRTEPWKEGWVAVDTNFGMLAEREQG